MNLKEQLSKGTFYYSNFGLYIVSKVTEITEESEDYLTIKFECGYTNVFTNNIKPIKRPCNIINTFTWCYILKNEYDDHIGYIGELKNND
ncbi:MAG: hypothetical protein GX309_06185 [Clostridiales bacterium]|nr:hypothetical protein [Clostridiales bacterium]